MQPRPHRTTWTFWSYLSPSTAHRLGSVHPVQLLEHAAAGRLRRRPFADRRRLLSSSCRNQVERRAKQPAPPHRHTSARANSRRRSADGFRWHEGDPKVPSDHPQAIPAAPHAGSGGSRTYTRPNRCPHLLEPPPPVVAGRLDRYPASPASPPPHKAAASACLRTMLKHAAQQAAKVAHWLADYSSHTCLQRSGALAVAE